MLQQLIQSIPNDIWERRPEPHMLSDLEAASWAYLFGGARETLATCADILGAKDPEEFEEKLELVALTGEHINGLDMMLQGARRVSGQRQTDEQGEKWPVVHAALVRVLGGAKAASVFADGVFLLHQRQRWGHRAEQRPASQSAETTETPDPLIWGELLKVDKGDTSFAAVLSLLFSGRIITDWMGLLLASSFREGQAAGVRVFASIFSGEEADEALRLADVKRIDWKARWDKARRVDAGIRALEEQWKDRTKSFSPFGYEPDEEDYDEGYEDADEWRPLGESA